MDQRRGDQQPEPCLCGSLDHTPIRDQTMAAGAPDVDFLRCPHRALPGYVTGGLEVVAQGVCWALNETTGLHCTLPPHDPGTEHWNAYAGQPWPAGPVEAR